MSKETYYSVKRDLIQYKYLLFIEADSMLRTQEPVLYQAQRESERERERALLGTTAHNRDFFFPVFYHAQRNYSVKRDLIKCQKRPITVSKETYYSVKRDPIQYKYFLFIEADVACSAHKSLCYIKHREIYFTHASTRTFTRHASVSISLNLFLKRKNGNPPPCL